MTSTDFTTWTLIAEEQVGRSDDEEFIDSGAPKFNHRFYRVTVQGAAPSNVIGYTCVTLAPGYSLIGNRFHGTHTIAGSFNKWPEGTTIHKFDTRLVRLTDSTVKNGKWTRPTLELLPGEGAIFLNPTGDYKIHSFAGDVIAGIRTVPIPSGFSLRSSSIPKAGNLGEDLHFPIINGDVVHVFDRDRQKYLVFPFEGDKWVSGSPLLSVGEAFWVAKSEPGNWTSDLVLPT